MKLHWLQTPRDPVSSVAVSDMSSEWKSAVLRQREVAGAGRMDRDPPLCVGRAARGPASREEDRCLRPPPQGDENTVRGHEDRDCTTVRVGDEQRDGDKRVAAAHERARVTEPAAQIEAMRRTNEQPHYHSPHRCAHLSLLPPPSISELCESERSLFARRKVQTRRSVAPAV
ncbi:hypothetical protein LTR48_002132 [Friedmanniomyces endolithicus]|uniref:Uncharacterized protein n=1 Tax=Rachicladosporium monterosium TaxID=1507873 RepID=A0ABR0LE01_9PEZI|nr:hypothetical protein LTR29_012292 [Friedmanniomyces endolithicus]KAK1093536.1 hypothetical protein LTR48_002132 [Friedmanniomyces endolithicus]KAK5146615.1 hypothetical protein LTR32_001831 [Rachicladosporium monterosium]